MGDYLLPAERRRHAPEPAPRAARNNTPRTVRSLRAQFENPSSVPPAPLRTRKEPAHAKTALRDLVALRQRPVPDDTRGVNDLISRFDRKPFEERNVHAAPDAVPTASTADTFGDLAHDHPKTDPGVEVFRAVRNVPANDYSQVPLTTQQSLRETAAFSKYPAIRRSLSAMAINEMKSTNMANTIAIAPPLEEEAVVDEEASDWHSYDKYLQELFSEAQTTAERAVQCDEQEDYLQALELYIAVVALYNKVMPFLTREEALDVTNTVEMYSRRCDVIRNAFASDSEEVEEEPEEEEPVMEVPEATRVVETPAPAVHAQETDVSLMRTRLPDYPQGHPPNLPDAPRGHTAYAASAAHRSSLSRPVSRQAIRHQTKSMTRERVAEIEEKMKLMKEALHNFTVKRKHLGPARAVEMGLTELNVKTFGELKRLAPLPPDLVHKWQSELEVLLGMLEEIKEHSPTSRTISLRADIAKHLPALKKWDKCVLETMASFSALAGEVDYVAADGTGSQSERTRRKWWVKMPVVKNGGLSPDVRAVVDDAKKDMEMVFRQTHEINMDVMRQMKVPEGYIDTLPRHARQLIAKDLKEGLMTWGMFRISDYMRDRNIYDKAHAATLCTSLEKVSLVWESKTAVKSLLSRTLDTLDIRGERGKNIMNALRRCQNAIRDLRREFPTMSQTELDMQKISKCDDIGHAGLEAYSRALESRSWMVLSRVKEIIEADDLEKSKRRK